MISTITFPYGDVIYDEPVLMNLVSDAAIVSFGVRKVGEIKFIDNGKGISNFCDIELHVTVTSGIPLKSSCDVLMENVRFRLEKTVGLSIDRFDVFIDGVLPEEKAPMIGEAEAEKSIDEMLRFLECELGNDISVDNCGDITGDADSNSGIEPDMGDLL